MHIWHRHNTPAVINSSPPHTHTCINIVSHNFYFSGSAGLALRRTKVACHLSVCVLAVGMHCLPYVHYCKRSNDAAGKISQRNGFCRPPSQTEPFFYQALIWRYGILRIYKRCTLSCRRRLRNMDQDVT